MMTLPDASSNVVLVSGAGPAGLTLALLLSRAGWRVVVVEKDAQLRGGGFLVSLADSAYHCMQALGLLDALRERASGIKRSIYYDAVGKPLLALQTAALFGELPVLQLMRDDLTEVLFRAAEHEADVRMGCEVASVSQDGEVVSVTLSSGENLSCDLLVGADGVHSNIRGLVYPPAEVTERWLGLHCAAYRHENVQALEHCFETHTQIGRYMATFSTGGGDVGSVFVWADQARMQPAEQRRRALLEAFAGSTGRTAAHLALCPQAPFYYDVLKQVQLQRWYRGRCVLLGDAAHCLTLFSGRGAAAAVNDASVLAEALQRCASTPQALEYFDARLWRAMARIQRRTRRDVRWYVPRTRSDYALRNTALSLAPGALFHWYFQQKYSAVS